MQRHPRQRLSTWLIFPALLGLICARAEAEVVVDTRIETDHIALVFEAEDSDSRDERWVLTEPDTPQQEDDPDFNHSDQAVGQAYLELLPDIRVTHADPFGPPTAAWFTPGTGPRAQYRIDFPQAGRYHVHVRAYSTGTEDNGLHIGLNGEFPDSARNLQFCTAGNGWSWSARQRDSGGRGPCGAQKTIWVTVEEPGYHDFMISAREDGFEIDRVMLIKDLSNNTRICKPADADAINCVNGSIENVDDVVDLEVSLHRPAVETEGEESEAENSIGVGETVDVQASIRNLDGYDTAQDVVLTIGGISDEGWEVHAVPDSCEFVEGDIVCELGKVKPSGPEDEWILDFAFKPLRSGDLSLSSEIGSTSLDEDATNDVASLDVPVNAVDESSHLQVELAAPTQDWHSGDIADLRFSIGNIGPAVATDLSVSVSMPPDLVVVASSVQECVTSAAFRCEIDALAVGETRDVQVQVTASMPGFYSINLAVSASNQDSGNLDDARDSLMVEVVAAADSPPDTGAETEPDEENASDATPDENGTDTDEVLTDLEESGNEDSRRNNDLGIGSGGIWLMGILLANCLSRRGGGRKRLLTDAATHDPADECSGTA